MYILIQSSKALFETSCTVDGAPPLFIRRVRAFLDREFPDRWIGRGGSVAWSSCSSDLTPLDFFLGEALNDTVYRENLQNINELHERVVIAAEAVTKEMLASSRRGTECRLEGRPATDNAPIEIH
jgi:hypothetical protein